jgi:hypothetical protein
MINMTELQLIAKSKKYTTKESAVVFLFIVGVFISLIQFFYNRSLWVDEAMLALNIIHRNGFELLKPLDYNQVAPILFLQIEKLFSLLIPAEYGLRIFPLLCYWAFLYFSYKIIKIIGKNNYYVIIFVSSFIVFNPILILYSSEAKQYMIDVFILSAIFYFTIKDYQNAHNKYYILTIVGALSILLSNVAPIILFISGLYMFYDNFFVTKNKKILYLSLMALVWLGVFSVYYYFFIYEHPTREFMVEFWSKKNYGFLPLSFSTLWPFIVCTGYIFLYNIFIFDIIMYFIMIFFCLIGIINLIRHKKINLIILTCAPFLLHLFLSAFQLYPVSQRAMLYILPCVAVIYAEGFNSVTDFFHLKSRPKKLAFTTICILLLICGLYSFPLKREETKTCIKYINEYIQNDEKVYVYCGAIPAFQYYTDIESVDIEFVKHTPVIYDNSKADVEKYMSRLKELRGKCWLLFSDIRPWAETYIISQLDLSGHKKIREFRESRSFIYLYDFGE